MTYQQDKLQQLITLMEQYSSEEGLNLFGNGSFGTIKSSTTQSRHCTVDQPVLLIAGQGEKNYFVGTNKYNFVVGDVLVLFYPLAIETEIVEATAAKPFLTAGIPMDLSRITNILLRLEQIDTIPAKPPASLKPSSFFSTQLNDRLLDPFVRLFNLLADHRDVAMLADAIVDEIYYRLLSDERGKQLRHFLHHRGDIQRISKAVSYIHQNVDQSISVEQLAEMVHMGKTAFYQNFKSVMHLSPLQYAKSIKLYEAQKLIQSGKKATEAGYLVGYNSPAQFSREYKRHFGFSPSAT